MAISYSGVNTWADEHSEAARFYTEAVMSNSVVPWVQQTGTLLTGVKANTIKLPRLSSSMTMQDGDNCAFNADGTQTISQSTITLKNIKFQELLCARTLEDYFTAVLLPAGQNYEGLGQAEAAMVNEIRKAIAKKLGYGYWNETSLFSGWIALIKAATGLTVGAGTTPTAGGAAGTDAAGVFNICQSLVATWLADEDMAEEIYNGNVNITMSPNDVNLYFQNVRTLMGDNPFITAQLTALAGGQTTFTHQGTNVKIYSQPALTGAGMVIMARNGNFTLAFDLESDNTNLKTGLDQYEENIWYTLRTKFGPGFRALDANNLRYWGPAS